MYSQLNADEHYYFVYSMDARDAMNLAQKDRRTANVLRNDVIWRAWFERDFGSIDTERRRRIFTEEEGGERPVWKRYYLWVRLAVAAAEWQLGVEGESYTLQNLFKRASLTYDKVKKFIYSRYQLKVLKRVDKFAYALFIVVRDLCFIGDSEGCSLGGQRILFKTQDIDAILGKMPRLRAFDPLIVGSGETFLVAENYIWSGMRSSTRYKCKH